MSIDYKFNTWRVSGERAEVLSPLVYSLLNKNISAQYLNGYTIGHILYLHHIQGMTAQEIRQHSVGKGIPLETIKSVIKGFSQQAGLESVEAYEIAMYLIENEPESLESLYSPK